MASKRYKNTLTVEQKAEEMVNKYGFADAKKQIQQIIFMIDEKDRNNRIYWEKVSSYLESPAVFDELLRRKESGTKSMFFQ
jgi:hypothetical protein